MNRLQRMENLSAYIDGELTADEVRLLNAWCESHPEDIAEYEALAEVVRQVRAVPEIEPPADLLARITHAMAAESRLEVSREQALGWLDEYLDDELSEPRRAVVEHYLQTDPEFAALAELHAEMLSSLQQLQETEPPADLQSRIEARIAAESQAGPAAAARRRRPARRRRRPGAVRVLAAMAAVLVVAVGLQRALQRGSEGAQVAQTEALPVRPAVVEPAAPEVVAPRVVEAPEAEPQVPLDESDEPVVVIESVETAPPAASTVPRVSPAERRPTPAVRDIAANERTRRTAAPARPAEARPAPRVQPAPPAAPAPRRPKSAPAARPAAPPLDTAGANWAARDVTRASQPEGAEFVTGKGNDSVLRGDNLGTEGNLAQGHESPSRGQVDPTRRSEAPPF